MARLVAGVISSREMEVSGRDDTNALPRNGRQKESPEKNKKQDANTLKRLPRGAEVGRFEDSRRQ